MMNSRSKLSGLSFGTRVVLGVVILLIVGIAMLLGYCVRGGGALDISVTDSSKGDPVEITQGNKYIAQLFEDQLSDVLVYGGGTVTKLLEDDTQDERHQRFIVELDNGHTLLIAHNIDVAPRVEGLGVGDFVEFYGEYYYSTEGGGVHWTHHDPSGEHTDGWIKRDGQVYD